MQGKRKLSIGLDWKFCTNLLQYDMYMYLVDLDVHVFSGSVHVFSGSV